MTGYPANRGPDSEWYRVNRTPEGTQVVYDYDDEGNPITYVDSQNSDFTGVGNFRTTVTKGTLWSDSTNTEERTSVTSYDTARGTYPNGGTTPNNYTPVSTDEAWLFGLSEGTEQNEPDAVGVATSKVETQYDADGFSQVPKGVGQRRHSRSERYHHRL